MELDYHTLKSFSKIVGLSTRLLGDLESGRRNSYDPATLVRVERALQWPEGHVDAILSTSALPAVDMPAGASMAIGGPPREEIRVALGNAFGNGLNRPAFLHDSFAHGAVAQAAQDVDAFAAYGIDQATGERLAPNGRALLPVVSDLIDFLNPDLDIINAEAREHLEEQLKQLVFGLAAMARQVSALKGTDDVEVAEEPKETAGR